MKDFEKVNADKTELHALKQFEKKSTFLGSSKLRCGHKCFQINNETLDCEEAKYESEVHFNKPNTRKIVIKENHTYINALNKKNALKVYKRENA